MPFCTITNATVFYKEKGEGEPLIFLNGLSSDHSYWLAQLRAFARRFRCIALDNRDVGQGASDGTPYSIRDLAGDVAEFMDKLQLPAAHIAGLSMGGMVAQELALLRPERVRSLSLLCTLPATDDWFRGTLETFELIRRQVQDTPGFFEAILPWWVGHRFFDDSERPAWLRWMLRQNPYPQSLDGFLRQLYAISKHDAVSRLPSIRCPAHIIAGEDDAIIPTRYSRRLHQLLPHARLTVLQGVGHAPPIEDARQFNQALGDFLAAPEVL
jgi:pimeloyl-ACP methyl ester carboxylesterase